MIEPIMFVGIGVHGRRFARPRHHSIGACARGAPHHAAPGSPHSALDGRNPGRQGPIARRIRHVDASARDERRADEGENHQPARRDRQEERGDRPPQARARRKDRGAVRARGQGTSAGRRRSRAWSPSSRPSQTPWRKRSVRSRSTQAELAQISSSSTKLGHRRQPARRAGGAARADRGPKGQIESYEKEIKDLRDRLDAQDRRGRGGASSSRRSGQEASSSSNPPRRARPPDHRANHRIGGARPARPGADRAVRRAGPFPCGRRIRLRPSAQRGEQPRRTEADARAELADAENRHRFATEPMRAEKTLVEDQLEQSQKSAPSCSASIAAMKRDAENAWANERMENAVLRERINDVAAEVARLTATLEGPDSPIDAILGADAAPRPRSTGRQRVRLDRAERRRIEGHARRSHPRPAKPRLARAAAEPTSSSIAALADAVSELSQRGGHCHADAGVA